MMDELVKLKKSLKQWEIEFLKQHDRKPGKTDIDAASTEIQECYLKYTKIKKILKDGNNQSTTKDENASYATSHKPSSHGDNDKSTNQDEDNDKSADHDEVPDSAGHGEEVEVWGRQFDRKSTQVKEKTVLPVQKKETNQYLQKLGSKMFQQSLKMKNKGLLKGSYSLPKRNVIKNAAETAEQEGDRTSDDEDMGENTNKDDLLQSDPNSPVADNSSHSVPDPELHNHPTNFGKLFGKATNIIKSKSQKPVGETTDSFMGKFKSKLKSKQPVLPSTLSNMVSRHREKYGESDFQVESYDFVDGDMNGKDKKEKVLEKDVFDNDFEKEFQKVIEERSTYTERKCNDCENQLISKIQSQDEIETNNKFMTREKDAYSQNERTLEKSDMFEFENEQAETRSSTKIVRGRRNRISRIKTVNDRTAEILTDDFGEEKMKQIDPHIDQSEVDKIDENSDSDGTVAEVKSSRKRKGSKVKTTAPAKRRKTAVEEGSVCGDDGEETVIKTARKPVQSTARAKPVSSDNFIRLNMKIKTYKRKGKTMSGPQYKRRMWKQKMQARSKSYGDACFKCGQSGHWANKCPGNQSTGSGSSAEPVVDEDFPSLQEAAMLARGVKIEDQRKKMSAENNNEIGDTENMIDRHHSNAEADDELNVEAEIVRSRLEDPPPPPSMDPLIEIGENDPIPAVPDFVKKGLKKFGFDSFRPGQEEAVMRILCGLSTLVVLSTGGGKSLCYQLPAYLYSQRSKCIALVISPLVSLMEDQVTGLPQGIRGVCLHTNMTASQRESVLGGVRDGKAQFLLVSPEAIAGGSMSLISSMSSLPPVAFACIDEAHCLSEWSHNFRPSYLRLCKVLHDKLGVRCFLGLTATATLSTASDVARHLKITDFRQATVRGSPIPDNLYLSVSRDENRDEAIIGLLQGERFCNLDSIIIYCTRRDQTDRIATVIRTCLNKGVPQEVTAKKNRKKTLKLEWDAESYHAGLTPAQRKRVQNAFMSGRLRVVVATVAFGMGLDKSDVRGIIHYNMPKSFESYVQEIGRAGRDREPAQCHVFLDPESDRCRKVQRDLSNTDKILKERLTQLQREGKDLCELRRHTYANTVDYKILKRLVQKLFPQCRCREVHEKHYEAVKAARGEDEAEVTMETEREERVCPGHERALPIERTVMELDVKEEGISTLLCYLELHSQKWLENLSNVYATCKVQCYGGPSQLQAVAKKCPPVAVAIAKARKDGKKFTNTNMIEFPVVEISDAMGWDSGPVKKELKLLQWDFSGAGPRRTGVMVEFSELAFHFRSPGDLSVEELDDVLQFLHTRVQRQERTELSQLCRLYQALKSVSHKNYWMCCDSLDMARNDKLKAVLNEYFDSQPSEDTDNMETESTLQMLDEPVPQFNQDQVISDIRQFCSLYCQEHSFNGRAIARIFHGIGSPCFPSTTWGKVRRFWRSHLDVNFNQLMKLATKELIGLR